MISGLEGIRVIETAQVVAGPMAGRLLADWGADVIHIEHPAKNPAQTQRDNQIISGRVLLSDINYRAENLHRNKRSIVVDVSSEAGRAIMHRLLEKADVLLNNFRSRELKRFGLEYETLRQLNPRLIFACLTGVGHKGPEGDAPGFETTSYFARSGILHILRSPGTPPTQNPIGLGDNVAGLALAYGILVALLVRERAGVGQEVDTSLFQAGVFTLSSDIAGSLVTGGDLQQAERRDVVNAVSQLYRTKDGRWLRLALAQPDPYWPALCRAIGREELEHDPRFATQEPRLKNHAALFDILEEVFMTRSLSEWQTRLTGEGLPWGAVQTLPEVTRDPQARANDFFIAYQHPLNGKIEGVSNPVRLSLVSQEVKRSAPEFGQHTEEVLLEYGYTREDVARFRKDGTVV